jgi:hypothetical protein
MTDLRRLGVELSLEEAAARLETLFLRHLALSD